MVPYGYALALLFALCADTVADRVRLHLAARLEQVVWMRFRAYPNWTGIGVARTGGRHWPVWTNVRDSWRLSRALWRVCWC